MCAGSQLWTEVVGPSSLSLNEFGAEIGVKSKRDALLEGEARMKPARVVALVVGCLLLLPGLALLFGVGGLDQGGDEPAPMPPAGQLDPRVPQSV